MSGSSRGREKNSPLPKVDRTSKAKEGEKKRRGQIIRIVASRRVEDISKGGKSEEPVGGGFRRWKIARCSEIR